MKPILIDALHINMGGALMILNHFVDKLVEKNIDFVLLKDARCPLLRSEEKVKSIEVMSCAESVRKKYYKTHYNDFKAVLCLGNIPPAIKMPVPVHTYIHNVSLLKIPPNYSFSLKIKSILKRIYIRSLAKNTNSWIVQTTNTKNLVEKYLPHDDKQVLVYPFYYIPKDINRIPFNERTDYVFIGECTKAKGHEYLIEAWIKLAKIGIKKRLHLTVNDSETCLAIDTAKKLGANIINHGYGSFENVVELYNVSKATIYPSLNESLGLGIVEAIEAGCDVIACDLPYVHCISIPSTTFHPCDSESIANAVIEYEKMEAPRSQLLIRDRADDLIKLLQK